MNRGRIMDHRRGGMAAAIAATLVLGACAQGQGPSNETIGTLGGAAGGALLGSQFGGGSGKFATTALGAVLGGLAGRAVASSMSDADQERASRAEEAAVSRNETIRWNNPDSGNSGNVEPVRTYTDADGNLCRAYTHTVYIEGKPEQASGTACRQSDGRWHLIG
ncbi:RT0821/Lpp0805 family surface protein [Oleisolibacter albus]|uniref:RT0821/Lpp0805 family surface protein n=1 Tax=Oleisolibacter albus TaxID=2171757 RepID=UPI001EFEB298|nr:RT0821/Lpp0805 family surface protein [Oleisolibacter albus]